MATWSEHNGSVPALVLTTSSRRAFSAPLVMSLRRHHPDVAVLLVDCDRVGADVAAAGSSAGGPVVVGLPHIGLATAGHVTELAPVRSVDLVMALGARSAGWAALAEVVAASGSGASVVVLADTVRLLAPVPELFDAVRPAVLAARVDDATSIPFGGALPGVIALGADPAPVLTWWADRAHEVVRSSSAAGMDELWRDVPIGTAVDPLVSPELRLHVRTVDRIDLDEDAEGRPLVGGKPVRLVDLDHLDPLRPWWWTDGAAPRRLASSSPPLRHLLHSCSDEVLAGGWTGQVAEAPDDVVPVTPALRRWFGTELASGRTPPNPLVAAEVGAFLAVLSGPGAADGSGISLAADLVLADRSDVAAAFPSVRWADRDAFVRWLWTHGVRERAIAPAALPDRPLGRLSVRTARPRRGGVNLVGYLDGDLGLGVAARHLRTALESAGVGVASVSYDRTSSRRTEGGTRAVDAPYATNLLMITPDQLPYFVADIGSEFLAGRYNIGLWYWETDVLTERQLSSFGHVDEVWASTRYLADVFGAYDRKPVTLVPVPLHFEVPAVAPQDRRRLGLDDRFTVLFSFDFLSVMERKNPIGLVEAFTMAFSPQDGARLILKSINGDVFPEQKERLLDAIGDRSDIELWDRYLSAEDRLALVAVADCYASLHRSEGLGLTMAEAMAVGTPVVATAYSGNLDFMDADDALLVPAEVVRIGPGQFYPADGHWAAPDLEAAAAALRRLSGDPTLGVELAVRARESIARIGVEAVGMIATARLRELGLVR